MLANEIKALLVRNGITIVSIAKKEGVTRTWVSLVVNGRRNSSRIREAVAAAAGAGVDELWPNRENLNR